MFVVVVVVVVVSIRGLRYAGSNGQESCWFLAGQGWSKTILMKTVELNTVDGRNLANQLILRISHVFIGFFLKRMVKARFLPTVGGDAENSQSFQGGKVFFRISMFGVHSGQIIATSSDLTAKGGEK